MNDTNPELETTGNEFIAFRVGDQDICMDIMSIREIRGWTQETSLPHAPKFVRGVINLRGAVLPIVDLGCRLGLEMTEPGDRHVIIVAQFGAQLVGLLVETVSEILTIDASDVHPTPEIACEQTQQFIKGTATVGDRLISVLNVENILPIETEQAA